MTRRAAALAAFALAALPGAAWAHTGLGQLGGFASGFLHPLLGLDHLLAMVGVGLWAARLAGPTDGKALSPKALWPKALWPKAPKALWAVPLAFLAAMTLGGGAGLAGLSLPGGELGIAGSVVLLGLLLAAPFVVPTAAAMALVAAFAVFHGVAHGLEMPASAGLAGYLAGFLLATAALHGLGVGLGLAAAHAPAVRATRLAGGAMALAGAWLLVGA